MYYFSLIPKQQLSFKITKQKKIGKILHFNKPGRRIVLLSDAKSCIVPWTGSKQNRFTFRVETIKFRSQFPFCVG